jgi:hypothetical protein
VSSQRYSPEFKDEAVRQIIERGYTVAEVSERLGVSSHSLYKWVKAFKPNKTEQDAGEYALPLTPLRTWQGWLYLAVVVDLYSRKVVGWSMKPTLTQGDFRNPMIRASENRFFMSTLSSESGLY